MRVRHDLPVKTGQVTHHLIGCLSVLETPESAKRLDDRQYVDRSTLA